MVSSQSENSVGDPAKLGGLQTGGHNNHARTVAIKYEAPSRRTNRRPRRCLL